MQLSVSHNIKLPKQNWNHSSGHMTPLTFNSWYQLQSNPNGTVIINTGSYDRCGEDSTVFVSVLTNTHFQEGVQSRPPTCSLSAFRWRMKVGVSSHSSTFCHHTRLHWSLSERCSEHRTVVTQYTLTSFKKPPVKESCDAVRPRVQNTVWRLKTLTKK